ncbi:MAG: hypothetical protein ACT4NP_00230 [Pseudonocardiales bacterium]
MSRLQDWDGSGALNPGTATEPSHPATTPDAYGRELADMVDLIRSGRAFAEPTLAERLSFRLVAVLDQVYEQHAPDEHGQCLICRPSVRWWRPWSRRAACTVHAAFAPDARRACQPRQRRTR